MPGRMVRSCVQTALKAVNSVVGLAGMAVILYALWMLRAWYREVNAVASEDTDCLAYGMEKFVVNFKLTNRYNITEYHHQRMLDDLGGLTKDKFIDFCILAGCDYCEFIQGMDAQKALELIQEYEDIEKVFEHLDRNKYKIPRDWMIQMENVRRQFKYPKTETYPDYELICTRKVRAGLKDFLMVDHGIPEYQINAAFKVLREGNPSIAIPEMRKRHLEERTGGESSKRSKS